MRSTSLSDLLYGNEPDIIFQHSINQGDHLRSTPSHPADFRHNQCITLCKFFHQLLDPSFFPIFAGRAINLSKDRGKNVLEILEKALERYGGFVG